MRLPVSWLKDYVDVELSPAELAERLTFSGLEVEGIETWGADLSGLVVGEVRAVDPHPGSDSLSVCSVFDGARTLQVVCGARNAAAGDKVPLAPEGARLPGGAEIRRAIIHGVESSGMLCAEDEIGFSEDHSGVMILPRGLAAGTPLSAALGGPEPVLVLEVTPNRPDCLSVIGVAREVAALCGRCLKLPSVQFPENGPDVSGLAAVRVEDPAGCPRYTARVFSGVRLGPSPVFIRRRLLMCGVRPINNVVDITNYVMLECGQPLHAFDRALLDESRVVVRRARPGEKIATLDEAERGLSPDMLVIADASKPVAVAGVMGGRTSGINAGTGSVLLESACFAPPLVRSAARGLDMATESSHRFERGVDVMLAEWASRQFVAGLLRVGGWFRAISPAVVHGMLAGIGVLIVVGQFHVLFDDKPLSSGLHNLIAMPGQILGLSNGDAATAFARRDPGYRHSHYAVVRPATHERRAFAGCRCTRSASGGAGCTTCIPSRPSQPTHRRGPDHQPSPFGRRSGRVRCHLSFRR